MERLIPNQGEDGAIVNFMDDIYDTVVASNGVVLELGVGVGTGSTYAIHQALKAHKWPVHISIDIQDRMQWKPPAPWWTMMLIDTRDPLAAQHVRTALDGRTPGVIFIDTEHTYEQMKLELALWGPLAGPETTWLFHDVQMWGNYNPMTDAIKEYAEANGLVYDDWRTEEHGLGRMRHGSVI